MNPSRMPMRKPKIYAVGKGMTVSDVLAEFVDGPIIKR